MVDAPAVPLEDTSVLSRSNPSEARDGVVEPVRAGELVLDSFAIEALDMGDDINAFSFPVTASEMALSPIRGLAPDWGLGV